MLPKFTLTYSTWRPTVPSRLQKSGDGPSCQNLRPPVSCLSDLQKVTYCTINIIQNVCTERVVFQKSCKLIYCYVRTLAPKDFKRVTLFNYCISKTFLGIREKVSRRGLMYRKSFSVFIRKITPGSIFQTVNTGSVTCYL